MPGLSSIIICGRHSNVGGACDGTLTLRQILGKSFVRSWYVPAQLRKTLALIDLVLGNAVATQDFENKMFNVLDKPLYVLLQFPFPGCLMRVLAYWAQRWLTAEVRCW